MSDHDAALMRNVLNGAVPAPSADVPDFIPADGPFDEEQRAFLNGLFSALYALNQGQNGEAVEAKTPLTILFGSQSGTAEALCKDLRKFSATQGFEASIAELDSVVPGDLAAANHVLIVAATYGEGEPTDNAQAFHKALMAADAAALPASTHFSVLGLGDTSYPHFNRVAQQIDERLAQLGATRAAPLIACDVDYDADYAAWRGEVFAAAAFAQAAGAAAPAPVDDEPAPDFDKNHPFIAQLIEARCLNAEGSAKRVNHIEISLTGGGPDLEYEVGDALGVWPLNDFTEVRAILDAAGFSGKEVVEVKGGRTSLRQALFSALDLMTVSPKTSEAWGVTAGSDIHLIDVLRAGVPGLTPQMLAEGLRPIQPRLYSISSSPKMHPGEVHLTVGEVHYSLHGTERQGVASTFLGERLSEGGSVGVYVHKSSHFYLPQDDDVPLIMIGPGTGIAPFRAFLEEREVRGAGGDNWLFFGDQHEATDFLYRDQVLGWQESGLIAKLSLAWSRDGAQKVYVQHLIEEDGAELFAWLERGAAIYICGDASRMAVDVERALLGVIAKHGVRDEAAAEAYLDDLRKAHRYQRDVY